MTCPSCGFENREGAKFCSECGAALGVVAATQREERKVVTVLFADLVGFTSQAERLDPEEVRALLQPYHARLREILERHGGTVEKFIGDAVMAVFGAPIAHEDDPERAVRAALAIRDRIVQEGRLQVRVGITTGEALVALGARPEAGEGMASGDVVNAAARLQTAAPVNGVLVDETTHRATSPVIVYADAEPVVAKGKSEPIPVFEARESRSRHGLDVAERAPTALVGRGRELDLLAGAFERVRGERVPQLVTLVGVPGIGKSRLVLELFRIVADDPDLIGWRQGRSLPYGEGATLWALAEMVKAQAGIFESDGAAEAAAKLAAAVDAAVPDAADSRWVAGHLRPLVGLGDQPDAADDRRDAAFAAWRRFFEGVAERGPLVLVFEDLQWADDDLLDFVDHLVEWAADVPLLVVATARPELLTRRPAWGGGKPNATTQSLAPLSDDDTARLVHGLLDRAVLPAEVQASLVENAGGNPLYAEEFARMLEEREAVGERGELELPATVQGIIAARLDGLSLEEKALLQDASVVGKVFWLGSLSVIGGVAEEELERRLHELERRELVRRERQAAVAGERQYAFRHLLVREVAYSQIPRAARAEKHRLAAEWIESLAPDRTEDRAEMLAHHYRAALQYARATGQETAAIAERARAALVEAADRAVGLNAFAAAAELYVEAFALWPDGAGPPPQLRLRHAQALHGAADDRAEAALADARDALLAAGVHDDAALAQALLAQAVWHRGYRSRSEELMRRAVELVEGSPSSAAKARVLTQAASGRMVVHDDDEAIRLSREALTIAEELGLADIQAHALDNIGSARLHKNDLDGIHDLKRGIEIALSVNSPEAARGYTNLAATYLGRGELAVAAGYYAEGARTAERLGHVGTLRFVRGFGPLLSYCAGDFAAAEARASENIDEYESGSPHVLTPLSFVIRAMIQLGRGEAEQAAEDARQAVVVGGPDFTQRSGDVSWGIAVLAETGAIDEARGLAHELLAARRASPHRFETLFGLAAGAVALGVADELRELLELEERESKWVEGAIAVIDGDDLAAAEIFAAMPSLPDEALARLRAARRLFRDGRGRQAVEQLDRALAFWRSVGASAYVAEAEALRAQAETAAGKSGASSSSAP